MELYVEMIPEGAAGCPDCFGAGFVIDDPGGPLKDMPPRLPARACQRCHPGQRGIATIGYTHASKEQR